MNCFHGYRALAIKSGGKVLLRSRNDNDFNARYPGIVKALVPLPDDTVTDGEVVALDPEGKPSFNLLQNHGSAGAPLHFFIFDLLVLKGKDVMGKSLMERRELLEKHIFPKMEEPIRYSPVLEAGLKDLIQSVKAQGLERLVAKRRDSKYEPGLRSGAWLKMRVNQGQELVIGGYTPSPKNFDALVIGYYEGPNLIYAARTRNGFTPASRAELFKKIKSLEIKECPFANLPEKKAGRWGAGLTAAKMAECIWVKPQLVGQFEYVEWTEDSHLRHSRFMALRDDKKPTDVRRE
jgi:DNA ligase D-like protein (predicted ligase)